MLFIIIIVVQDDPEDPAHTCVMKCTEGAMEILHELDGSNRVRTRKCRLLAPSQNEYTLMQMNAKEADVKDPDLASYYSKSTHQTLTIASIVQVNRYAMQARHTSSAHRRC
jgi:hypothetical protein